MPQSSAENPHVPDEPPKRIDPLQGTEPRPDELESRMNEVEATEAETGDNQWPRPWAAPGEDEGPLAEGGGQLRGPDAAGSGG